MTKQECYDNAGELLEIAMRLQETKNAEEYYCILEEVKDFFKNNYTFIGLTSKGKAGAVKCPAPIQNKNEEILPDWEYQAYCRGYKND